jgi:hypothetical protein
MSGSGCAVRVQGEEVTIEADHLACKFGLSTETLRSEMRRGIVYGIAERGVGEDAGRTRLTFRYRARSWTPVVEPDGTCDDASVEAGNPGRSPPHSGSGPQRRVPWRDA